MGPPQNELDIAGRAAYGQHTLFRRRLYNSFCGGPYLDTSALVKRYVSEPGSGDVDEAIAAGGVVATATIARAEGAAAFAKAARIGSLRAETARACHKASIAHGAGRSASPPS